MVSIVRGKHNIGVIQGIRLLQVGNDFRHHVINGQKSPPTKHISHIIMHNQ